MVHLFAQKVCIDPLPQTEIKCRATDRGAKEGRKTKHKRQRGPALPFKLKSKTRGPSKTLHVRARTRVHVHLHCQKGVLD